MKKPTAKPMDVTFLALLKDAIGIPKAVEWTQEDAASFRNYLKTPSGAKLRHLLLSRVAAFNEWATNQPDTNRACGQAQGFKTAYAYTLSLAEAQIGKSEPPADSNGTAGTLDHLRP